MLARILLALGVMLLAAVAKAQSPHSLEWLESYTVADDCPSASEFRSALRQRVSLPLGVAFAGLKLAVDVRREARGATTHLLGRLRSTDAAGTVTTRTVAASSCDELIQALSLIAGLSARSLPEEPLGAAPPHPPSRDEPPPRGEDEPIGKTTEPPPETARMGPGLFVLLQNAASPQPQLGVGVGLSVAWPARGAWAPWLHVGAYRTQSADVPIGASGARAHFRSSAAHLIGCPIQVSVLRGGSLQPCLDLDLGRLQGSGEGGVLVRGASRSGWWASTGLALRAEVSPWGPLRISTLWGLVIPWTRHEFFFAPDTLAFRVPALGWRGALSGAVVF